jgi:hypothetical protein
MAFPSSGTGESLPRPDPTSGAIHPMRVIWAIIFIVSRIAVIWALTAHGRGVTEAG